MMAFKAVLVVQVVGFFLFKCPVGEFLSAPGDVGGCFR